MSPREKKVTHNFHHLQCCSLARSVTSCHHYLVLKTVFAFGNRPASQPWPAGFRGSQLQGTHLAHKMKLQRASGSQGAVRQLLGVQKLLLHQLLPGTAVLQHLLRLLEPWVCVTYAHSVQNMARAIMTSSACRRLDIRQTAYKGPASTPC